jgi:hypothetical protein
MRSWIEFLLGTYVTVKSKGRDTPDAIRQRGLIFQFLKVNTKTVSQWKEILKDV